MDNPVAQPLPAELRLAPDPTILRQPSLPRASGGVRFALGCAVLIVALALGGCRRGPGTPTADRPFIGSWKAQANGQVWTFNDDGTCSLNGSPGRWQVVNGRLVVSRSGQSQPQQFRWRVTGDGQELSLDRPNPGRGMYTTVFRRE